VLAYFPDRENGGFFDTSDDHEKLIQRPKGIEDNAIPSGNARAAHVLLQLGLFTGDEKYTHAALRTMNLVSGLLQRYPFGFGEWLGTYALYLSQPREVALVGDLPGLAPFLAIIRSSYQPFMVVAASSPTQNTSLPLLSDRPTVKGQPTAYVCRNFVCQAPITDPNTLLTQIQYP
jgi:uncharacterized protein